MTGFAGSELNFVWRWHCHLTDGLPPNEGIGNAPCGRRHFVLLRRSVALTIFFASPLASGI